MASPAPFASAASEFAKMFSGQLLRQSDPGYDEARRLHNGLVNKRPLLIARCRGVADIVDAVKLAREHKIEVAVRGGGHNVAGRATIDGGLMIDLSLMKGIHVDPKAHTVRAQGGVTWAEFNRETQLHGLATTGGVISTTGIAGLTLGGGYGYLMGTYGMAVDNLLSVEIVTADGRLLRASKDENPDLFWGVRGGGGNFGVVVSLEYRLHRVGPMIAGGFVAHPIDKARDVLRFYRDVTTSVPDELTVLAGLLYALDEPRPKLAGIVVGHSGALGEGEAAVQRVKKFGSPAVDLMGPISYCQQNELFNPWYPRGIFYYWKSSYLAELSDQAIDTMIDSFARCPSPLSQVFLEHYHGAATRVAVDATAFPHRQQGYNLLVLSQWTEQSDNDRNVSWTRETYAAMEPFRAGGRYVNYMDHDEADAVAAAYGPNYRRLRELKAKYDPDNFFHMNQNIHPLS